MKMESSVVVTRGWREGNRELFNVYRVSVWNDEKVLEIQSGDGCTTLWIYLMPLNYTLKMIIHIYK